MAAVQPSPLIAPWTSEPGESQADMPAPHTPTGPARGEPGWLPAVPGGLFQGSCAAGSRQRAAAPLRCREAAPAGAGSAAKAPGRLRPLPAPALSAGNLAIRGARMLRPGVPLGAAGTPAWSSCPARARFGPWDAPAEAAAFPQGRMDWADVNACGGSQT